MAKLLLESGTYGYLLEDGSGNLLLEIPAFNLISTVSGSAASGTSLVLTVPAPAAGNLEKLAIASQAGYVVYVAQAGVTWTMKKRSGSNIGTEIWDGTNITSAAGTTITITVLTGITCALVQEWSGWGGSDQSNTMSLLSTTMGGESITPTAANELVWVVGATNTSISAGPTGGFTAATGSPVTQGGQLLAVGYLVQTTAVAAAPTWTIGSGGSDSSITSNFAGSLVPLSSLAVTPATPSIGGGVIPFTAIGTFNDGSTADVTSMVTWTSGTPGHATITSTTGVATAVGIGTSTITATSGAVNGGTVLTVTALNLTYNIYRNGVLLASNLGYHTYHDSGLPDGTSVSYQVSETLSGLQGPLSSAIFVTPQASSPPPPSPPPPPPPPPPPGPPAPTNLVAIPGDTVALLSWS